MAEVKLTALQQRFFLAMLEGKEPADAFKAAKAPVAAPNELAEMTRHQAVKRASELMRNPRVRDALARARAALQAKVELRVEDLVEQLMETRQIALTFDPPQASAAVAATMGIAKLLGLVVDRSQLDVMHHKPSPVPTKQLELSEDEWRKTFHPAGMITRNDR